MNTVRKPRVLYVEDNPDTRKWILIALADEFDIQGAELGVEAVLMFTDARDAGSPYDIVMLDLAMPDMSGFEVAEAIRKVDEKTPLVAYTAFTDRASSIRCERVGIQEMWSKALLVSSQSIIDKIKRVLFENAIA